MFPLEPATHRRIFTHTSNEPSAKQFSFWQSVGAGGAILTQWQRFTTRLHQLPLRSPFAGPRAGPKTVLLQRLEGQPAQLDGDRCLETPVHQQPSPRRRVDCRPFLKFQPHGFSPRDRLEDRHATYSSKTSSPDQYIPTEHGMPTRSSIWRLSRPPNASYCSLNSVLEYDGDAETTAHSLAPVAWSGRGQICRCTTRSSATLPLKALPSVVKLGRLTPKPLPSLSRWNSVFRE